MPAVKSHALVKSWPTALACLSAGAIVLAGVQVFGQTPASTPLRFELPPAQPLAQPQLLNFVAPPGMEEAEAEALPPTTAGDEAAPRAFAQAFADLGSTRSAVPSAPTGVTAQATRALSAPAAPDGVLKVRFDLADPYALTGADRNSGPIELKKAVRVNGTDAGAATIRVTEGATIAIAREELGRLLADAGRGDLAQALPDAGFINFDRIRRAGLNVRYDPIADRILVSG